jgi:decaprenylphospho-beta-D-erythro-pentofuranosid-2-ulose 2-reductase
MNQTIAIFGATSAIAKEYARLKSKQLKTIILIGRDQQSLNELKNDLIVRGAKNVNMIQFDFENIADQKKLIHEVFKYSIDIALFAYGTLPDQEKCKVDSTYLHKQYLLNAVSNILLINLVAEKMKQQGGGIIAAITSVAGDRGKKSNYIYGSAKAGVSVFLQGLSQELFNSGVHILDIRPGFVDTPMTENFEKNIFWVMPKTVAQAIDRSIQKKKNIVYIPCIWRYIMFVIRLIPESIFKRIKL